MTGPVLVTGATGFIGRHLVARLQLAGVPVRQATRDPATFDPVAMTGIQTLVHLAARVHVLRETSGGPLAAFRAVNVDLTVQLARAAVAVGVKRFVFLSSIGVLGEATPDHPFLGDSPPAPASPYARSKWEAEEALRALSTETGLEVVIIRPPLVYGPGARGNLARLLRLVASGVPLPLAGVRARRTFVGIENLCALVQETLEHPGAPGAPLLAGDRESLTLPELLQVLAEGQGRSLRLFHLPGIEHIAAWPVVGPTFRKLTNPLEVDISATCRRLDWQPHASAREGLLMTARAWVADPW